MSEATVMIRSLAVTDSVADLTDLLHRAYKSLLDMGLHYLATHQTEQVTRQRIAGGTCLVATIGERIVGTVTYHRHTTWDGSLWMSRPDVATVGQFAVEPVFQKHGIGSALMAEVEKIAAAERATELALNTAEPAAHLITYYTKRGYRFIERTDATLNQGYRSVILSKTLPVPPAVQIRQQVPDDTAPMCEAARESISEIAPWMPWCHPNYSIEDARDWIATSREAFERRTAYEFAIVSATARYLGNCGVNQIDAINQRANIGYWVRSSEAGRGIATAAVRRVRDWTFANTDLIRLEIVVALENTRSLRVAEKVGARREGVLKNRLLLHGTAHDAVMFALLR